MGVDCFKIDFGECILIDVQWFDGFDLQKMYNYYVYIYNELVWNVFKDIVGEEEVVLFVCLVFVGVQKFLVYWGGDCYVNYELMVESLCGGLFIGFLGFGFWSYDIGGFENIVSVYVYKCWCVFGLFFSYSCLYGSKFYCVLWVYDDEFCDVVCFFM